MKNKEFEKPFLGSILLQCDITHAQVKYLLLHCTCTPNQAHLHTACKVLMPYILGGGTQNQAPKKKDILVVRL